MIPKENMQIIFKDKREALEDSKMLRIIHFNDVYNVEGIKEEPVGGAARFATALDFLRSIDQDHLVLFSGDAFSPSTCNFGLTF